MPMKKKVFLFAGVVAFLALLLFVADPHTVLSSVASFPMHLAVLVLLLSFTNYIIRFLRWHFLLAKAGAKIGIYDSLLVFFSSFLFVLAPAKSGDFVKPYYLKTYHGIKYPVGVSVVVFERISDVLSLSLLLSLSSLFFLQGGRFILLVVAFSLLVSPFFLEVMASFAFNRISFPFFKQHLGRFKKTLLSSRTLFSKNTSFLSLLLGTTAWFLECAGFFIVVQGFAYPSDIAEETFVYSAGTLGGAVAMVPGGLGVAEGGMTTLLSKFSGISFSDALSATLVIRAFTLWFAVALGFVAFVLLLHVQHGKNHRTPEDKCKHRLFVQE